MPETTVQPVIITQDQFNSLFPGAKDPVNLCKTLNSKMFAYGLTTLNRAASFIAQCGHESGGFKRYTENLNYSAEGLLSVFKKYFTPELAAKYARKPEAIGSRVYANRLGNGDEASKEGYKYRGHGLIQLTGKANFAAFGKSIGKTVEEVLAYIVTPEGIVESALWFWKTTNCNKPADANDIKTQTKIINGGYNGLEERLSLYSKVTKAIKVNFR